MLYCREVGVSGRTGSMGPLCGIRLGRNASLTHNNNNYRLVKYFKKKHTFCDFITNIPSLPGVSGLAAKDYAAIEVVL